MYICIGLVLNLPPENKPRNVIANGRTTVQQRQTDKNLNIKKKTNHFDKWPKTYRPFCNGTANKPTLKPTQCFLFFFPPHFFKNNFSQPHKWHIWFCSDTQADPSAKPKEPLFCQRNEININVWKFTLKIWCVIAA